MLEERLALPREADKSNENRALVGAFGENTLSVNKGVSRALPKHSGPPDPENESAAQAGTKGGGNSDRAKGFQNLHVREYQEPAPDATNLSAQWLRRDAICELAAVLESLAISLGEAAFVGADHLIEAHTRQAIATVKATAATVREFEGAPMTAADTLDRTDIQRIANDLNSEIAEDVESIIRKGRKFLEAKERLGRGNFLRLFANHKDPLPHPVKCTAAWANAFMKIAAKLDELTNNNFNCDLAVLPPDVNTLAYLFNGDMDPEGLRVAFDEGWITPLIRRKEVKEIRIRLGIDDEPPPKTVNDDASNFLSSTKSKARATAAALPDEHRRSFLFVLECISTELKREFGLVKNGPLTVSDATQKVEGLVSSLLGGMEARDQQMLLGAVEASVALIRRRTQRTEKKTGGDE